MIRSNVKTNTVKKLQNNVIQACSDNLLYLFLCDTLHGYSNKQQLKVTMDSYRTYSACSLSKHTISFRFSVHTQNWEKFIP